MSLASVPVALALAVLQAGDEKAPDAQRGPGPLAPPEEVVAPALTPPNLLAEFDERTARRQWIGFEPDQVPILVFDGERSWLTRHPAPPEGFELSAEDANWTVLDGRPEDLRKQPLIDLAGHPTAVSQPHEDLESAVADLVVATFHVHQALDGTMTVPDHAAFCDYPMEDSDVMIGRRLELAALRNAVSAKLDDDAAAWARRALGIRAGRYEELAQTVRDYERALEEYEGLAHFVRARTMKVAPRKLVPLEGFAPAALRERAAVTGAALAVLLDRFDKGWRKVRDDGGYDLAARLAEVLESSHDAIHSLSPGERVATIDSAVLDAALHRVAVEEARTAYVEAKGWTLRIVAKSARLEAREFDGLETRRMRKGELLHDRLLVLENATASVRVEGRRVLTQTASERPLADGVDRLVLTGFRKRPESTEEDGVVTLTAPGLEARFEHAELREGEDLLVLEF